MRGVFIVLVSFVINGCASIVSSVGDDFYPNKTKGKSEHEVVIIYADDEIDSYDVALYEKNKSLIDKLRVDSVFSIKRTFVDEKIKIISAVSSVISVDKMEPPEDFRLRHPRVILPAGTFVLHVGCRYQDGGYVFTSHKNIPVSTSKGDRYIASCYKTNELRYAVGKITKLENI